MAKSSHYLSCYVSVRERQAGEIIPAGAELSALEGYDNTADKAIDLDLSTYSRLSSTSDSTAWFKVKLGEVHCIREVVEFNSDGSIQHTWTWNGTRFSCVGENCLYHHDLLVETEGEDSTFQNKSSCKNGDSVKLQLNTYSTLAVYEIAVFTPDSYKMMVMCDDYTTIYVDGEEKNVYGTHNWDKVAILHIPTTTTVVGIKCENRGGNYGIMVRITDKEEAIVAVSDSSWKCSNQEKTGWSTGSIKEDEGCRPASEKTNHWGNPPFQEQVIWTASGNDTTVLCRKVLPDTATDYYTADCTGLKTEWTSTIETTTQFPVDPETVVTVTCSNSDAVNVGSSEVTCNKETDFTFSIEPSCSNPVSCEGLPDSWRNMKTETQFPLPPGNEVSLKCRTGYTLSGDKTVTCQEGGTFSFTNPPVCQLDTCSGFPSELSSLTPDNTFPVFHNTALSVSCTRDSLLMGDNFITCVKGTDFHFQDKPICKAFGKSY
ncbi:hypothetical protein ACHWQZ_G017382 [Mnemiopsis leidyi]